MRLPISTLGAILNGGAAGVTRLRRWLQLVRRLDGAVVVRRVRVCALRRSMNAHVKESALILLEADDEIESGDDKNRSRDPSDGGVGTLGGQADLA